MDKEYYIYMHKNKINGKIYIGQSCQTPSRRWGKQGERYKGCSYFYSAIQKYGWDNFEHIILEQSLDTFEANIRETYWIKYYETTDINKGYNLKEGGNTQLYSEESKNKMKESAKNRFQQEEERKKQSDRIKQSYLEDASKWDNVKKPIKCLETEEIFSSTTEAAKWCGINALSSFGNYFAGRSKSCGRHPITKEKLHWERVEE